MFKDILGNEIKAGDKIIYFTTRYSGSVVKRTATIRYFKVDRYGTKAVVDVERDVGVHSYCTYITRALGNCVKVTV